MSKHETGTILTLPPNAIRIVGGAILPDGQRGKLDTATPAVTDPLYDERLTLTLDEGIAADVKARGVTTPVHVAFLKSDPETPVLVKGRQRLRAARQGKVKDIPALVVDGGRLDRLDVYAENIRMADPVSVMAAKAKRALDAGDKKADVARALGVKPATVDSWLAFERDAIPEVKTAVADGAIPFRMGLLISKAGNATVQGKALAKVSKLYEGLGGATGTRGQREGGGNVAAEAGRAIAEAADKRPTYRTAKDLAMLSGIAESMCSDEDGKPMASEDVGDLAWWSGARDMLRVILGGDGNPGTEHIFDQMQSAIDAAAETETTDTETE